MPSIELAGRRARVEPQIGRDLIVAAAAGVQAAPGSPICSVSRASTFMCTSSSASSHAAAAIGSSASTRRSAAVIRSASAGGMRPRDASISACADRRRDVVRKQAMIEADRRVERRRGRIQRACEPAPAGAFGAAGGIADEDIRRAAPRIRLCGGFIQPAGWLSVSTDENVARHKAELASPPAAHTMREP